MYQTVLEQSEQSFLKLQTGNQGILRIGHLVRSVQGRDRGRFYLVIGGDGLSKVLVADGEVRKVENPKYKNIKHLYVYDTVDGDIATKDGSGKRITNLDIRQGLKILLQNLDRCSILDKEVDHLANVKE